MPEGIPESVKIGTRNVAVKVVDYSSPNYVWEGEEKIEIRIDAKVSPELQVEQFWSGLVRAVSDYIQLLDEIEKEVGNVRDLPDFNKQRFGKVLSQVIAANKLG